MFKQSVEGLMGPPEADEEYKAVTVNGPVNATALLNAAAKRGYKPVSVAGEALVWFIVLHKEA